MTATLAVIGGVIMALTILHWFVEAVRDGAAFEERLRQAEQKAEADRKMAEEMLKERTVEDVVRDLDAGEF